MAGKKKSPGRQRTWGRRRLFDGVHVGTLMYLKAILEQRCSGDCVRDLNRAVAAWLVLMNAEGSLIIISFVARILSFIVFFKGLG